MIYGICKRCSHTQSLRTIPPEERNLVYQKCFSCGSYEFFRVVRQVEQPDGSVIEVTA